MTIMEVFFITEVNSDVEFVPGSDVLISQVNEEQNVPEHFIYFFQEQRQFFYLTRSEKQFIFFIQ